MTPPESSTPTEERPAFLVDANMPRASVETLREQGFDAEDVRDIGLGSADDDSVVRKAKQEDRIVVTRDTDFGLVLRHPDHPGALILRLPYTYTASQINERLGAFLDNVEPEELLGSIITVELDRYRRRPIE